MNKPTFHILPIRNFYPLAFLLCTLIPSTLYCQGGGGGGGGGINGTSIGCGDTDAFSLGNSGFTGSDPTSATGSCGQCCYSGSDLDGDGDQDVSFSTENGTWYEYCNNTGATMDISVVVDETNNNCNLQGAVFVGSTSGGGTIDCSNSEFQEYGSNMNGNADGFTFNNVTVPNGQCAYIFIDGYAGAACGAATISIVCPCTPPVITASASPTTICSGASSTLTAGGASTYTWSPTGSLSASSGTSVTASPTSTTTYTVTGTDALGCVGTTTVTVTVTPPPVPNAGSDQSGCAGTTFTIGADPIYNVAGTAYSWSGGGGSGVLDLSGGGQDHGQATVSPASTTTYTVTITTAAGCVGTDQVTITITPPIVPTFNAIPNQCQNSTPPSLPGSSTNSITGTWSPATINTSTLGTSTYTFTPTAGQCASTTTLNVTVSTPPTPTFNALSTICQNSSPPSLPTTSTNGISGTWNAPINTSTAGTTTYTFTPNAGQCGTTATMNVTISSLPLPNAGTDQNGCLGTVFTIGGNPVYGVNGSPFSWTNGAGSGNLVLSGNPNNQVNGQVSVNPGTTTNYTLSVTGANTCVGTDGVVITIDPCVLPVNFNTMEATCAGAVVLEWSTFSEQNNDYFTIERRCSESLDDFEEIGQVDGSGNSHVGNSYRFVDHEPTCAGLNYYRLSQTDFDGVRQDISVRAIHCTENSEPLIQIEAAHMVVHYADDFDAILYGMDGKILSQGKSTDGKCALVLPRQSAGMYTLVVISDRIFKKSVAVAK